MQRALADEAGLPFNVAAQGTYLGVRIGPDAAAAFWAKARLKFHSRVSHVRATAGPARERLMADMLCASSVLHYLAQLAPIPRDLQLTEAARVVSLLAAPMWAFTPEALAAMPRKVMHVVLRMLPMIAQGSSQRMALQHHGLAQLRDTLEADAGGDEALLLPRSPPWLRSSPLAHALQALRRAADLPHSIREHGSAQSLICRDLTAFPRDEDRGPLPGVVVAEAESHVGIRPRGGRA